jgi:histidyl-tRNA synthetase
MALSTDGYKGTRDFYPEQMRFRRWAFGQLGAVCESFGYEPYDGPMLESFDLYAAKTGEEIVNRQLYHLKDQSDRRLAVRPEMTPTMARMVAAKIGELPRPIRWYSIPNLWRYERPQRGRLREHWQLNVDVLGGDILQADLEILSVATSLISSFGSEAAVEVRINHRALVDHFFEKELSLEGASKLAVMKLVDAKDKMKPEAYEQGLVQCGLDASQIQKLKNFFSLSLDELHRLHPNEGSEHLLALFKILPKSIGKNKIQFDPSVMRGLDYYTGMVFEIFDTHAENRRAMFGGGRYDNLIGLFGKESLSGVGFGMGDVTLENFLEVHGLKPKIQTNIDVLVGCTTDQELERTLTAATRLRASGANTMTALRSMGFGDTLKSTHKHGVRFALLFGEDEWNRGAVLVKDLREGTQEEVLWDDLEVWWSRCGVKAK